MEATHRIEVGRALKRRNGALQYIYRIVAVRGGKTIAASQQYSRKVDVMRTVEAAYGPLLESGKFALVDLCGKREACAE
jgi:hypothetical protein